MPLASAPVQQGIFLVSVIQQEAPTVEVRNETPVDLYLIMNREDGKTVNLKVSPKDIGEVNVPVGHYEAKVFDKTGQIKSAFGTADIIEYRKYEADFVVKPGGGYMFHIGG